MSPLLSVLPPPAHALLATLACHVPHTQGPRHPQLEYKFHHTHNIIRQYPGNWTEFVEYYHPRFHGFFLTFPSWQGLREMLESEVDLLPPGDDRIARGQREVLALRAEGLAAWRRVLVGAGVL